jgi:hypothetical protein
MRNFVRNKNGGNKQQNHAFLFSFLKVKNQLTVMMTLIDGMIELRIYKKHPTLHFWA